MTLTLVSNLYPNPNPDDAIGVCGHVMRRRVLWRWVVFSGIRQNKKMYIYLKSVARLVSMPQLAPFTPAGRRSHRNFVFCPFSRLSGLTTCHQTIGDSASTPFSLFKLGIRRALVAPDDRLGQRAARPQPIVGW